MTWSLSEAESLARKAASGAGLPWGIAEEAGKATRWLCAAGLPGAEALADLLLENDEAPYDALCPTHTGGTEWNASRGSLCPLIAGAALCDAANDLAKGRDIILSEVSYPILLVPYVVIASDMTETPLSIHWSGVTLSRGEAGTYLDGDALDVRTARNVRICKGSDASGSRIKRSYRADISTEAYETLSNFAQRTYAPDTPESRLAGAGAGLSDND